MRDDSGSGSWGLMLLRVMVGVVFLAHGGQKLFVFGFHGVAGMLPSLRIPLPVVSSVVVTVVEFLAGAGLLLGLATRIAAALLVVDMLVAVLAVHLKNGFFSPTGFEYPLTLLVANLCLALAGPGELSIDGMIARRS
jgi:putative oxidoreductase